MPSAGGRHFWLTFCCRLDKKEGVWRDATRRFKGVIAVTKLGGGVQSFDLFLKRLGLHLSFGLWVSLRREQKSKQRRRLCGRLLVDDI